ncbi:TetR/AcrR family transcriptional regulator [Carnobacterium divergens]|uniref:TetR/AcrR family transcriptional regulator n=1 Tax=Carnobacterium divergens TaxID=2748 RepID=UPI0039B0384A
MYQGNNPTALISQQLLLEAFTLLLNKKGFKDITISELCTQSGVSRQTFYSLYKTKENLLLHHLQIISKETSSYKHGSEITLIETCRNFSKFVIKRKKDLAIIIENDLMDILKLLIYQETATCRDSFITVDEDEAFLALEFMASGLAQLTKSYLINNKNPNEDELTQIAYKIMSGSIYRAIK